MMTKNRLEGLGGSGRRVRLGTAVEGLHQAVRDALAILVRLQVTEAGLPTSPLNQEVGEVGAAESAIIGQGLPVVVDAVPKCEAVDRVGLAVDQVEAVELLPDGAIDCSFVSATTLLPALLPGRLLETKKDCYYYYYYYYCYC
eukprot:16427293-Heterocapsa_arctica.AAC.1